MHFIIIIFSVLSTIYAFPYGIWEYKQGNKLGGIVCYFICILCVGLSISNLWIE